MATPTTRTLELSAPTGAAVSVAVTSGGGWRPVVVLAGRGPTVAWFVDRLARAGFATVARGPRSPAALTTVLDVLERGDLGVDGTRDPVLAWAADGSVALTPVLPVSAARGRCPASA